MDDKLLQLWLSEDDENRFFECKSALEYSTSQKKEMGQIFRTVLAMANGRETGYIVIGVREDKARTEGTRLIVEGVTPEQEQTWDEDKFCQKLFNYCDPMVHVSLKAQAFDHEGNRKRLIVIEVKAYDGEGPIVCKKDYNINISGADSLVMKAGAIYIRPLGAKESREVKTSSETRELLDRAISQGVAKWAQRSYGAGVSVRPGEPSDLEKYKGDVESILNSGEGDDKRKKLVEKILSHGYWKIWIAPEEYQQTRLTSEDSKELVKSAQLSEEPRYPYMNRNPQFAKLRKPERIETLDRSHNFVSLVACTESALFFNIRDLDSIYDHYEPQSGPAASKIYINDAVYQLVCATEFAFRFGQKLKGVNKIRVSVELLGIKGRETFTPLRYLDMSTDLISKPPIYTETGQIFHIEHWDNRDKMCVFDMVELQARHEDIALEWAQDLISYTGWEPPKETLRRYIGRK